MTPRPSNANHRGPNSWVRVAVVVFVLAVALYNALERQQKPAPVERPAAPVTEEPRSAPRAEPTHAGPSSVIPQQTIRDQNEHVIFRGEVDVGPTLARIERGERLSFSHDGIVFQNRERRLPQKPSGYYREYVHPTPGTTGPGPQRIIIGRNQETYYTPDHYRTFRRLDE